uniref:Uncharacterized protein n=1 Tax=Rhizophora mucronata TaxID=61149 RepID=A0A2P2PES9_RHIMU
MDYHYPDCLCLDQKEEKKSQEPSEKDGIQIHKFRPL